MLIVTMVRESALVENVTANQAGSCMTALVIFSATFIYIVLDSSREKTFLDLIFQPQFFLKNIHTKIDQFYPVEQRPV